MPRTDQNYSSPSRSQPSSEKKSIVQGFTAVGALSLIVFGFINVFVEARPVLGTLEISVAILSMVNVLLLNHRRWSVDAAGSVILSLMIVVLGVLFVTGGLYGTGLFWFFTFPVLSLYLKGTRRGLVWIIGLGAGVFASVGISAYTNFTPLDMTPGTLLVFISSFVAVTALLYVNELVTEKTDEDLEKFKLAVDNTSQHIIITDTSGVITYANAGAEAMTGYSRAEMIGTRPSLWGGQMPKSFYESMWQTIKVDKKTFTGEIQNKRKNGEQYTASTVISPVVDARGEVQFFVGIETDITKQKELDSALMAENARVENLVVERTRELREEEARLRASINSMSFGFILADMNHHIILKNPALMAILDISGNPTSIDDIKKVFTQSGRTTDFNLTQLCAECIGSQKSVEVKEVAYGKKFLRIRCVPIAVEGSETTSTNTRSIGSVVLVEDITESKVQERSRDEFFSIASHELRTPLTAIRGNSEMILEMSSTRKLDKDLQEMLEDINISSIRLISIVNDFLQVSRLEQGTVDLKKECFDISTVLEKVIRDLKSSIEEQGLLLVQNLSATEGMQVCADRGSTEQVLINLIGNAAKFTTKGTISVTTEKIHHFVKIRVSDTGIGIPEQNQALLFRKFQQAGESTLARDVTQGTGLGLYISHLLVSAMGGSIGLEESVLGKGSTFTFTVPLYEDTGKRV